METKARAPHWAEEEPQSQFKVQGQLTETCSTHILLITNGKRNQQRPKFGSYLGVGGLLASAVLRGPFSKVLLGENGPAARGAIRSVSASMRSDTQ